MQPSHPVIDVHTHISPAYAAPMLALMDAVGVEAIVTLPDVGADLAGWRPALERVAPGRFIVFTAPRLERVGEPGGVQEILRRLEVDVRHGAAGIKVYKEFGLRYKDGQGRRLAVDDPRLDPLWRRAGELGMPVLIHTGDPADFWKPCDETNPRYAELQVHPEWWFGSGDFPPLEQLLAERDRLVARHPGTRFIAAHLASLPHDLDALAATLDRLPNLWVDLAARIGELGVQNPGRVRAFFQRYADRILFGSDLIRGVLGVEGELGPAQRHFFDLHWRYLEGNEPALEPPVPLQGTQPLAALGLPPDVLRRVYRENARRLLGAA